MHACQKDLPKNPCSIKHNPNQSCVDDYQNKHWWLIICRLFHFFYFDVNGLSDSDDHGFACIGYVKACPWFGMVLLIRSFRQASHVGRTRELRGWVCSGKPRNIEFRFEFPFGETEFETEFEMELALQPHTYNSTCLCRAWPLACFEVVVLLRR